MTRTYDIGSIGSLEVAAIAKAARSPNRHLLSRVRRLCRVLRSHRAIDVANRALHQLEWFVFQGGDEGCRALRRAVVRPIVA